MTKEIVSDFSLAIKAKLALHPSIYLTCLTADKNGTVFGVWINADQPLPELIAAINRIVTKNPPASGKTWKITRCEDFGSIPPKTLKNERVIHYYAAFFAQHGRLGMELYHYLLSSTEPPFDWASCQDFFLETARYLLDNHYYGAFESRVHFVKSRLAEIEKVEDVDISHYQAIADSFFAKRYFSIALGGAAHIFDHPSYWLPDLPRAELKVWLSARINGNTSKNAISTAITQHNQGGA